MTSEREDVLIWKDILTKWRGEKEVTNIDTNDERCDVCDHLGMHCQYCDADYDDGWSRGNCEDDPYITGEDD